jgi:hypothetical protein
MQPLSAIDILIASVEEIKALKPSAVAYSVAIAVFEAPQKILKTSVKMGTYLLTCCDSLKYLFVFSIYVHLTRCKSFDYSYYSGDLTY